MGLAEQMVGIKAKTFLMSALFDYAKKYSFLSTKWPEVTNEVITSAMKIFAPDEKRIEEQTQKFLQWLGFTPVDLEWDPERKILNIYIGTSRIWRDDPTQDQVSNVMMKAVISSIGSNFFGGKTPHVEFLQQNLPPRTSFGFRITESLGSESFDFGKESFEIHPAQDSVSLRESVPVSNIEPSTQNSSPSAFALTNAYKRLVIYIEPIVGSALNKEEIAKDLFDACSKIFEQQFPDEYRQLYQDIGSYNILQVFFQKATSSGKLDSLVTELAESFASKVRDKNPTISANDALSGLGRMDPAKQDELLFYTKEAHASIDLCKFISKIWLAYINKFMPKAFVADSPMCKITSSGFCLYAFNLQ